jgi:hypothetical protein
VKCCDHREDINAPWPARVEDSRAEQLAVLEPGWSVWAFWSSWSGLSPLFTWRTAADNQSRGQEVGEGLLGECRRAGGQRLTCRGDRGHDDCRHVEN